MVYRIEVGFKPHIIDALGERTKADISNFLGSTVDKVRTKRVFTLDMELKAGELERIKRELFVDPIIEETTNHVMKFDWLVEW